MLEEPYSKKDHHNNNNNTTTSNNNNNNKQISTSTTTLLTFHFFNMRPLWSFKVAGSLFQRWVKHGSSTQTIGGNFINGCPSRKIYICPSQRPWKELPPELELLIIHKSPLNPWSFPKHHAIHGRCGLLGYSAGDFRILIFDTATAAHTLPWNVLACFSVLSAFLE